MTESTDISVESSKKPLYATVGAGDAAVQTVADVVAKVRERAETVGTDVSGRVETLRERLAGLPADLPERAELREKFTVEELRKFADDYRSGAVDLYADLATRGEGTLERLRTRPRFEQPIKRAEDLYSDVFSRTEDAWGKVSERTRALGEQASKLVSRIPGRTKSVETVSAS